MSTSAQCLLATFITTWVWHVLVCSRILIKCISHSRCIRNLASLWLTSYVYTTFNLGTKQEVAYQMRHISQIKSYSVEVRPTGSNLPFQPQLLSFLCYSLSLLRTILPVGPWTCHLCSVWSFSQNAVCHQGSFLASFVTQLKSQCLWKFLLLLSFGFQKSGHVLGIGDTKSSNIASLSSNPHSLAGGQT